MKNCMEIEKVRWAGFLLPSLIFLSIFLANFPLAATELISPDASGYLDIGRNLFSGKGALTCYNFHQLWQEKYHPFLPYMQPIFPIVAGVFLTIFSLKAVIVFNVFISAINGILLYRIIRLRAGCIPSFLITLFVGFSPSFAYTAIYVYTEQLHLFFLLLAVFMFLRHERFRFLLGVILATGCLVRVANFYNVLAFGITFIVLRGFSKEALKENAMVISGFLTVFLSYELFCYIMYGTLYPQFVPAARIYGTAAMYPGAYYREGFPVLNMPPLKLTAGTIVSNICRHLCGFIRSFGILKFVIPITFIYIVYDLFKKKASLPALLFFQGICVILGYSLSLWCFPAIELKRYCLVPFVTLGSICFLAIEEICRRMFSKRAVKISSFVFILVVLFFLSFEIRNYLSFRDYYKNVYPRKYASYRKYRDEMYGWIKANTEEDVLIASNFVADAFFFDRPFVSLPHGKAFTGENLLDFLRIYKPGYILTDNEKLINWLESIGFAEKKRNRLFVLIKLEEISFDGSP